jgi:para-aminobenzoate synthetase component I
LRLCFFKVEFKISDQQFFKQKALKWANGFDAVCYLDSNNFPDPYSKFDALIAVGTTAELMITSGNAFEQLKAFRKQNTGWITGFFSYDLKNQIENMTSNNTDRLLFPDLYFFAPQHIIRLKDDIVEIESDDAEQIFSAMNRQELNPHRFLASINLQSRFSKEGYIATVKNIQSHIARGDIYVTNFCQEFYAEDAEINPLDVFTKLNNISPNPFASYFKWKGNYILCASPERFLAKHGTKLISQPIKGTAKRGTTLAEDEHNKQQLRNHTKELQENVMVVDLVRNDLTRSAKQGTVKTDELFGIYTFNQLHQMISTVTCEIEDGLPAVDAIKNTFPMGSMTGAPKISAMKLIEHFERSKRGVYSGAVGYFGPDGDFDFNVVIRTILYNSAIKYLSFQVGSAITYHADAAQEYDECLLKAKAILEALDAKLP